MDSTLAQLLENGDLLGVIEWATIAYANNAPEEHMQHTDAIFVALQAMQQH